jgi:hypothetical protein
MLSVANGLNASPSQFVDTNGNWAGRLAFLAGFGGSSHGLAWFLNQPALSGNWIDIDITPYIRAGAQIDKVILVAEADTGNIDLTLTIRRLVWLGTGSSYAVGSAGAVNVGNTGRKIVEATVNSGTAGASTLNGQYFYKLRIRVGSVNAGASGLGIYAIYLKHDDDNLVHLVGSYTSI